MKIQVFKSSEQCITRDYDLTNCSVIELVNALFHHCEVTEVEPMAAAVVIPASETGLGHDLIIKGTSTNMSMQDVAIEILKLNHRKPIRSKK